jgi:hypothetical protein
MRAVLPTEHSSWLNFSPPDTQLSLTVNNFRFQTETFTFSHPVKSVACPAERGRPILQENLKKCPERCTHIVLCRTGTGLTAAEQELEDSVPLMSNLLLSEIARNDLCRSRRERSCGAHLFK